MSTLRTILKIQSFAFLLVLCMGQTGYSVPFELNYSGRLTSSDGAPLKGPIELRVRFFRSTDALEPIDLLDDYEKVNAELDSLNYPGLPLSLGLFSVKLTLSSADAQKVFSGKEDVYIELTDMTNHPESPFARQRFYATPFSLKVPVDQETLVFSSEGKLEVNEVAAEKIAGTLSKSQLPRDVAYLESGKVQDTELSGNVSLLGQTIEGSEIASGSVDFSHLSTSGCSDGQVIKFDNATSSFRCSADLSGDNSSASDLIEGELHDDRLSSNVAKLNQNNNFTGALLQFNGNDLIDSSDVGSTANKIIQLDGSTRLPAVDGSLLTNVNASSVSNGIVGTDQIATDAVTSVKIDDGAIAAIDLATDSVTSVKIDDGTIAAIDMATDSVTSVKIDDGTIAAIDLASDSVTSVKIDDGAVGTDDLADDAVTAAKIADSAVGSAHIVDNSVTTADIARVHVLTLQLPTTNGHAVHIGTFTVSQGVLNVEITISMADGSYSFVSFYRILSANNQNSGTRLVLPVHSSEDGTRPFDLELKNNGDSTYLAMIRRAVGSGDTPNLYVHVRELGESIATFDTTPGSNTDAAATVLEESHSLHQVGGKVGVHTDQPDASLHIAGSADIANVANDHGLAVVGSSGGAQIIIDNDEIQARFGGLGSTLKINEAGGETRMGSDLHVTGDITLTGSINSDGWNIATLLNGWVLYSGGYSTLRFRKDKLGRVHLTGLLKSGTCGQPITTLPAGYRPATELIFRTLSNNTVGRVDVLANGNITPGAHGGPCSSSWFSFEGVSFFAEQ